MNVASRVKHWENSDTTTHHGKVRKDEYGIPRDLEVALESKRTAEEIGLDSEDANLEFVIVISYFGRPPR